MKNFRIHLLILLSLFTVVSHAASAGRPKAKRVVLIALDGISVNGFKTARTPCLDELLSQGALSLETRVVMPSVTLPNWTSHLTGSGPEQHGVADNDWQINKRQLPPVAVDADGYYPSVFQVLKEALPGCRTAFYYNWANLIYPYNRKYFDEVGFLENDGYVPNYQKAYDFIVRHQEEPVLVFLYSVHTDHAGHNHKWMSPEYIRSIEEADRQIGDFVGRLKQAGLYEDTHFLFLSDHGGVEYGHGGLSEDEMIVPWGITGPGIKSGMQLEEPNNTVNTAATVLYLFQVAAPSSWTGEVPYSVFE